MNGFGGARVLSLESRKSEAMEQLIRRHGGVPFVAPSVKEAPFEQHDEVYRWAEQLAANHFDLIVFMTGTGLAFLRDIVAAILPPPTFAAALCRVTIVARGPKPAAILNEMGVTAEIITPEPNTWREIVPVITARPERRIAIQEYGRPNPAFAAALELFGAEVATLAIYRWTLPDDLAPLREAVRRIAHRECDVVLFTTSIQLTHLLDVADAMGVAAEVRRALAEDIAIGSVGPVMNGTLADYNLTPDIVPLHPKMPMLVRTAAETAATILKRKKREGTCGDAEILSRH